MTKEFNERDEYEIRIDELFWSVLRHWRAIIVVMVIVGILLGGFGAFREYRKYRDPDVRAAADIEYANAAEEYDRSKAAYEAKLENLREWIDRQDNYKESSLLLMMDPYNVYKAVLTYYIDSSYEIMPEMWYQNPNYTKALVNSYASGIAQMKFDDLIDLPGGPDLTTDHTVTNYANKKICSIEKDVENSLITITVICDTEERSDVIVQAIKETMSGNETLLNRLIGEHKLCLVNETGDHTIDVDLVNMQARFETDYDNNSLELVNTEKALDELTKPVKTVHSKGTIIKQGMKFGILGLIVGLVAAAFFIAVSIFGQRRVVSASGVQKYFDIPVLAVVRSEKNKMNALDRRIASRLGFKGLDDPDAAADYAVSTVRLKAENNGTLMITGTAAEDELDMVTRILSEKIIDKEIRKVGNVSCSASAVNGLVKQVPAVCVEKWPSSAYSDIEKELEILRASDNDCIGFILVV